ncbi:IgA peptidase M64-domain-containing protein [Trametes punicea]|nr:IgA peptidase M64-domain-containing protein [Trametes punicea]
MGRAAALFAYVACWLLTSVYSSIPIGTGRGEPTYELDVIRNSTSLQCKHLALQKIPQFRGVQEDGYFRVKQPLGTGEERIQYVAHHKALVWTRAESLCGLRDSWDFPALVQQEGNLGEDLGQVFLQSPGSLAGGSLVNGDTPPLEVLPLIASGDSSNRVNLVFFADGYTSGEKDKFIKDAMRLAEDISGNQTFYTVKPLLNFWAAFTPSRESGIGSGGKPKDTPFGLYRDGTELRAVYYSKPEVARAACFSLGSQCDYPILMGNDPLYGGLGGEFTVITPSLANGALVLRHELGHSIIDVGEEYDGGFAYFGVNAAHNKTLADVPWAHWLTNTSSSHTHAHDDLADSGKLGEHAPQARVERSVMPMQAYPWTLLNASAPWSTTFNSSGTYAWHLVRFSLSGLPDKRDLRVELDGKDLGWVPRADIGIDRWHYDIKINRTLKGGEHEVRFTLRNAKREGEAQLCSVEVLEFGNETEFVTKPGHYSLYPTFSEKNETSYRPTNEDCLMRIVTTPNFCKACTEGLWHALLRRVSLIDDLELGCEQDGAGAWKRTLELSLVPLAHLRENPVDVQESYSITWLRNGEAIQEFANKTKLVDDGDAVGSYVAHVQYTTEEVRVDKDGLLASTAALFVTTRCGV